ncbi:MAG TPA: RodZ domain-containing protein [Cerasibacillus sp.]|uniref:helix-turn-helix domain-containing protein n=1 Tax=Cerasibacillus sp. TaxID=2498711 RepID=UPI002F3F4163
MEIGERLKEARKEKNISLESLQDITKIQKRYLMAIEEGNFDVLPGKFYARAFIKEYALVVGLDPDELLEEFKSQVPMPNEEEQVQYTRLSRSQKDKGKGNSIFSFIPTLIVVLLIIGIILLVFYFMNQKTDKTSIENEDGQMDDNEFYVSNPDDKDDEDDEEQPVDDDADTTDETKDDNETTEHQSELKLVETGSGNRPESTFELVNPGDEVKITFESKEKTWLEVSNTAGERLFYNNLTKESSPLELDVTSEEKVYIQVGYAPDLTITVNGTELEYPVDPNEAVTQKIWVHMVEES